jgi:hypothetical protein
MNRACGRRAGQPIGIRLRKEFDMQQPTINGGVLIASETRISKEIDGTETVVTPTEERFGLKPIAPATSSWVHKMRTWRGSPVDAHQSLSERQRIR